MSYSFDGLRLFNANTAIVDAETLDDDNNITNLTQTIANPTGYTQITPRVDWQINPANTFIARYEYDRSAQSNAGAGQLLLTSQAYNSVIGTSTVQLSDSTIVNANILNEARFQYTRAETSQTPSSTAPTIIVEGAFTGGGSNTGLLRDNAQSYELQDYVSFQAGKHGLRFGARQRMHTDDNQAESGFNGEYIFPTLAAYQQAQQALAANPNLTEVAGANQFTITSGNPSSAVRFADTMVFFNDSWTVKPNLVLGWGVRGEGQNHTADKFDVVPRLGFSWNLGKTEKKPAFVTLEGGAGLFYTRLPIADLEQVARLNGTLQTQYVITNPTTYPVIPPIDTLSAQSPSSIFLLSNSYSSPYTILAGISAERDLGKYGSITLAYDMTRGVHQLLEVNTNAPLPGTYVAGNPIYPYGGTGQRDVYETAGVSRQNRLNLNGRLSPVKGMQIFFNYTFSHTNADSNGVFPSNQYDIGADYGRASTDVHHRFFIGSFYQSPWWNLEGGVFAVVQSGTPFNIVLGNDLNGDGQFNDRPAFATDLSRASVVETKYGNFDTDPIAGQTIIPNNYANGPGMAVLNAFFARSFHFGSVVKPPKDAPPPPKLKPGEKPPKPQRRFSLELGAYSENLLNHVNPAPPIGTLGSPLFGISNALSNPFGASTSANRTVNFQAVLQF